ncbi:ABC transporter permease [uncultured Amnibacterium sp.]|uniref:ABC transporter permease n=1 Tax=uncultured Amnibacterium sp. TaxID=1631851 RepID=UPI0035CAF727
METIALFVLLGLGPGALIAGVSLGVVMVYRASGMINFATGVIAAWGAFVFYGLRTSGQLLMPPLPVVPGLLQVGGPWDVAPAFLVAVIYCALIGLLLEVAVIRPLRTSSPLTKLLASLGIYLFLQSILNIQFGDQAVSAPAVLPSSTIQLFGIPIPVDRFILLAGVLAATGLLLAVYRFTRFGLATRASSESETNAALFGLRPQRLSLITVVIAQAITGAFGILVAPLITLDTTSLPNLIIPALAAALLARFTSFGVAALAGIAMGIVQSLVVLAQSESWFPTVQGLPLPGVSDFVFFVVVVVAMLWQGGRILRRDRVIEKRLPPAPAPKRLARPALIAMAAVLVGFLVLPYNVRQAGINSLIGILLCLSLVVIIGFVGQVSLLQLGLAGVSGFAISKLAVYSGVGFPLAPLIGIAVATAAGVAVSFVAVRVRGVNLAVVTLAAAVALENFVFDNTVWGNGQTGSPVPAPTLFGIDLGPTAPFPINGASQPSPLFGILIGIVVILSCLFVSSLRRSRLGQRMLAVRDNESAAAASGINVLKTKLTAFAVSSALAGLAGVLYAYNFQSVSTGRFGFFTSLTTLAFAFIGGITTVRGAVIASIGVSAGVGSLLAGAVGVPASFTYLIGGLALVVTIILKPEGLASPAGTDPPVVLFRFVQRRIRSRRLRRAAGELPAEVAEFGTAPRQPVIAAKSGTGKH